jgi:opacity protein-like surface antigen
MDAPVQLTANHKVCFRVDAIVNTALNFLNRTEPMLGAGGGVVVQGGPVFLDLGHRYKKILAGDSRQGLLTGGDFGDNEVRIGAGFRF